MAKALPALSLFCLFLLLCAPAPAQTPDDLDSLLQKAWSAADAGRYASPERDCVLFYTRKILKADPGNRVAQALEDKAADYVLLRARNHEEAGDLRNAIANLKTYLNVRPEDHEAALRLRSLELRFQGVPEADAPSAPGAEIDDFNAAEKAGSPEAWRRFLQRHPDSQFADYARRQLGAPAPKPSATPAPPAASPPAPAPVQATAAATPSAPLSSPAEYPAPTPDTGSLLVEALPAEARAEVTVAGQAAGPAPAEVSGLRPGGYALDVRAEGYEPWSGMVEVAAGQQARVQAALTPTDVLFSGPALHVHALGRTCAGTLRVYGDRIEYLAENRKHSVVLFAEDISFLDATNPYKLRATSSRTRSDHTFELGNRPLDAKVLKTLNRWADGR